MISWMISSLRALVSGLPPRALAIVVSSPRSLPLQRGAASLDCFDGFHLPSRVCLVPCGTLRAGSAQQAAVPFQCRPIPSGVSPACAQQPLCEQQREPTGLPEVFQPCAATDRTNA